MTTPARVAAVDPTQDDADIAVIIDAACIEIERILAPLHGSTQMTTLCHLLANNIARRYQPANWPAAERLVHFQINTSLESKQRLITVAAQAVSE